MPTNYTISDFVEPIAPTRQPGEPKSPLGRKLASMPVGKAVMVEGVSPQYIYTVVAANGKRMGKTFVCTKVSDGKYQITRDA